MNTWPVSMLVPHAGNMILLDDVQSVDDEQLSASATVKPDGVFNDADGSLPAWAGVEIMAQGIAAWAGTHARRAGTDVQLGFLLGTRRYTCHVDAFPAGLAMRIEVKRSLQDSSGMNVFECYLRDEAGTCLASARLNVYQPPNPAAFIQEQAPA